MDHRPFHLPSMSVVLVVGAIVLSSCSTPAAGLPTAGGPGPGGSPAGSAAPSGSNVPSGVSTDPAVAWPAFAACLRAHGLNVADPVLNDQGEAQFTPGLDLKTLVAPAIEQACSPLIAGVTGTKAGAKSYDFDSLVAHAACLRQHGMPNYPDPDPNATVQQLAPGFSKADPVVNAALVACQSLLVQISPSPSASN
jgi:hypothetical protein